jgi:tagatose 6-phosphate kinase
MVFPKLSSGHVNRARETHDGAAGKAVNVAKVVHKLGEPTLLVGVAGGDRGSFLRSILGEQQVPLECVETVARTRECITIIDESTEAHTELVEESPAVTPAEKEQFERLAAKHLPRCRALVLAGTICPGFSSSLYEECIRQAPQAEITVVDARGEVLEQALRANPGLIKPNRVELASTVNLELRTEHEVLAAMRTMVERGAQRVVVTDGEKSTLALAGSKAWRITAPRLKVKNPIGSGDSFTAGVVCRLLKGDELGEACRWGTACGSANALTWMAGEVVLEDVHRLLPQIKIERLDY